MKPCTVADCGRVEYLAHGYCDKHYKRWRKHGDPLRTAYTHVEERFWARVDQTGECWLWTGALDAQGYGALRADGRVRKAHQLAYEFTKGCVPSGLTIDHLCFVRNCVNPAHLEAVTPAENTRRAVRRRHPDREEDCERLYLTGKTQAEVGAMVGMDPSNVSRVLARRRVPVRSKRHLNNFAETNTGESLACGWLLRIEGAP